MKHNVQVLKAYELYGAVTGGDDYDYHDCLIRSDGALVVNKMDGTQEIYSAKYSADILDASKYEVVMVEEYGTDIYALMLYDER